jgi:hypothetical protein
LSGVGKPSFSPSAIAPKYQFKVYTDRIDFLEQSEWINELGEYLVCFYDVYIVRQVEIESRVVVFHPGVIVEFLFEPLPRINTRLRNTRETVLISTQQNTLHAMLQNYN